MHFGFYFGVDVDLGEMMGVIVWWIGNVETFPVAFVSRRDKACLVPTRGGWIAMITFVCLVVWIAD
jgi:hypothetical protein